MLASLILTATIACSDCESARRQNLDLALTWEHRARLERVALESCRRELGLVEPLPMIAPAPVPDDLGIGWIALAVGGVAFVVGAAVAIIAIER